MFSFAREINASARFIKTCNIYTPPRLPKAARLVEQPHEAELHVKQSSLSNYHRSRHWWHFPYLTRTHRFPRPTLKPTSKRSYSREPGSEISANHRVSSIRIRNRPCRRTGRTSEREHVENYFFRSAMFRVTLHRDQSWTRTLLLEQCLRNDDTYCYFRSTENVYTGNYSLFYQFRWFIVLPGEQ